MLNVVSALLQEKLGKRGTVGGLDFELGIFLRGYGIIAR